MTMYAQPNGPLATYIMQVYPAVLNQMLVQGQCSQQEAAYINNYMQTAGTFTLANGIAQREPSSQVSNEKMNEYITIHLYDTLAGYRRGAAPAPQSFNQCAPASVMTSPQYGYPQQPQYGYPQQPQYGYPQQPQYVPPASTPVFQQAPSIGGMNYVGAQPIGTAPRLRESLPPPPVVNNPQPAQHVQPVPPALAPVQVKPYQAPDLEEDMCSENGTALLQENVLIQRRVRRCKSLHTKGVELFHGNMVTDIPFATPQEAAHYVGAYVTEKMKRSEVDEDKRKYLATVLYSEPLMFDVPHKILEKEWLTIRDHLRTHITKKTIDLLGDIAYILDQLPAVVARVIKRMIMREFITHVSAGRLLCKNTCGLYIVPTLTDELKVIREFAPGVSEIAVMKEYTSGHQQYGNIFERILEACTKDLFNNTLFVDPTDKAMDPMMTCAWGKMILPHDPIGARTIAEVILSGSTDHHAMLEAKTFAVRINRAVIASNLMPDPNTQFSTQVNWDTRVIDQCECDFDFMVKQEYAHEQPSTLIIDSAEPGKVQRTFVLARTIDSMLIASRRC